MKRAWYEGDEECAELEVTLSTGKTVSCICKREVETKTYAGTYWEPPCTEYTYEGEVEIVPDSFDSWNENEEDENGEFRGYSLEELTDEEYKEICDEALSLW